MLGLCIGDICIGLDMQKKWPAGDIQAKYAGFWEERTPDFRLEIIVEPGLENTGFSETEIAVQRISNRVYMRGFDVLGEADIAAGEGWLRVAPNLNTLDFALKTLLVVLLPHHAGFMLHAAGLRRGEEEGWLLCGPSGSGKSTLSSKMQNGKILNDEHICVIKRQDKFYMLGTPFCGEPGLVYDINRKSVPLSRMVLLDAAKCGTLKPMEALYGLLSNVIYPPGNSRAGYETILDMAWELVQVTDCRGLVFDWAIDNWGILDGMGRQIYRT